MTEITGDDLLVGKAYHLKFHMSSTGSWWEGIGWRPLHRNEELVMLVTLDHRGRKNRTTWFRVSEIDPKSVTIDYAALVSDVEVESPATTKEADSVDGNTGAKYYVYQRGKVGNTSDKWYKTKKDQELEGVKLACYHWTVVNDTTNAFKFSAEDAKELVDTLQAIEAYKDAVEFGMEEVEE